MVGPRYKAAVAAGRTSKRYIKKGHQYIYRKKASNKVRRVYGSTKWIGRSHFKKRRRNLALKSLLGKASFRCLREIFPMPDMMLDAVDIAPGWSMLVFDMTYALKKMSVAMGKVEGMNIPGKYDMNAVKVRMLPHYTAAKGIKTYSSLVKSPVNPAKIKEGVAAYGLLSYFKIAGFPLKGFKKEFYLNLNNYRNKEAKNAIDKPSFSAGDLGSDTWAINLIVVIPQNLPAYNMLSTHDALFMDSQNMNENIERLKLSLDHWDCEVKAYLQQNKDYRKSLENQAFGDLKGGFERYDKPYGPEMSETARKRRRASLARVEEEGDAQKTPPPS
jgi:hypothetical protein